MLGDIVKRNNASRRASSWVQVLIDIATGKSEDASVALECVKYVTPIIRGEAFHVLIPILKRIYVTEASEDILELLAERIEEMLKTSAPKPKVFDGLDEAPEKLRDALDTIARTIDAEERGADFSHLIKRLRTLEQGGRLQLVIEQACARLEHAGENESHRPA